MIGLKKKTKQRAVDTNKAGKEKKTAIVDKFAPKTSPARRRKTKVLVLKQNTHPLQNKSELFKTTFDQAALGIAHVGLNGQWLHVNDTFCDIAGYSKDELLKLNFTDITHPDDLKVDFKYIQQLIEGKIKSFTMEKRYIRKNGTAVWVRATGSIAHDESGSPKYGIALVENIHEKKKVETALTLLSKTSEFLSASLDYSTTLESIAHLVVPKFACWCFIDLLNEKGHLERKKIAVAKKSQKTLMQKFYNYQETNARKSLLLKVLQTKKPILISHVKKNDLKKITSDPEQLRILSELPAASLIIVPLIARNHTLGVMTFISSDPHLIYEETDLILAQELAQRSAMAVDNAKLFQQAQEAIKTRDEFLSIASHELKTPLTSIKAVNQIIQKRFEKYTDASSLYLLSQMGTQLNKVTKLINDLLDASKIRAEKIIVKKEYVDLNTLIKEVVEDYQRISDHHTIIIKGSIKKKIWCDKDRIGQVVTNLLTNAIKYSPKANKVIIHLSEDKTQAVVAVQDFGIGISPKDKERIFDRFFRVTDEHAINIPGLGLGLYISNEIIQQHGGHIWVESKKRKGSTFFFSIPFKKQLKKQYPHLL